MSETHLKQPRFTYSACGPFTKNKQRIQRFMGTGYTNYIYKNEYDKACFQHDMAYGDFKDLKRRTQSDKVLKEKAFASNPKYDGYQRRLAPMVYKQWSINILTRNQKEVVLKMKFKKMNNYLMNFINQLLGSLRR